MGHPWRSPGEDVSNVALGTAFSCRVLTELVSKMRDMQMDKTELGCLRAIVLFNPGTALPPPVWPRAPALPSSCFDLQVPVSPSRQQSCASTSLET